jgi:uncharacterized protein (TIGR00251 family)
VAGESTPWVRERDGDGAALVLRLHVQPGGKQSAIMGLHGDRLKVRIAAPAVDGRANAALVELFAGLFGVARRDVAIDSGERHRDKTMTIRAPRDRPDREWAQRFGSPGR